MTLEAAGGGTALRPRHRRPRTPPPAFPSASLTRAPTSDTASSSTMSKCASCNKPASETLVLSACKACKSALYCGRACRRKHAQAHAVRCAESCAARRGRTRRRVEVVLRKYRCASLTHAATAADIVAVRALVAAGADVCEAHSFGVGHPMTPLFAACRIGHVDMARFLCDRGASPSAVRSTTGETPAFVAVGRRSRRDARHRPTNPLPLLRPSVPTLECSGSSGTTARTSTTP